MRVFVTGAAGYIGSAVVQELLKHNHQVFGLVRNDAQAEALTKAGAEPHLGSLEDLESLKTGAAASDGVIHLAFIHDFGNFARVTAVDRAAIGAMAEVLSGKPLVIATGALITPPGSIATEDTEAERGTALSERARSEDLVYALSKETKIRGMVVRLAPTVHGLGDSGFVTTFIDQARKNGFAAYIGDGTARWPAVHRLDAAVLFRLAVEKGRAGATYNGTAEPAILIKDIQALISKELQIPLESKTVPEAMEKMGFFGAIMGRDNPTSSDKTQKELGWHPKEVGLLADMEKNYFSGGVKSKYL